MNEEVAVADIRVFKPGDQVNLKSAGPCMTVIGVDDDGDVECVWFVFAALGTHYVTRDDGGEDEVEHGSWQGPFYGTFQAVVLEYWSE